MVVQRMASQLEDQRISVRVPSETKELRMICSPEAVKALVLADGCDLNTCISTVPSKKIVQSKRRKFDSLSKAEHSLNKGNAPPLGECAQELCLKERVDGLLHYSYTMSTAIYWKVYSCILSPR